MPCIDCKNWRLKQAGLMAKTGYGLCLHLKPWTFKSQSTTCDRHALLDATKVLERVNWLAGRSRRLNESESESTPSEPPQMVSRETTDAPNPLEPKASGTGQLAFS